MNIDRFSGFFTDYQIFGRSLTADEMHDITLCKSFASGDIYSWSADDWEPYDMELQKSQDTAVQYRKVDFTRPSLCDAGQKYTFFPDTYTFEGGFNVCRRFGGKLVDVSTTQKFEAIVEFLGKNVEENPKYD